MARLMPRGAVTRFCREYEVSRSWSSPGAARVAARIDGFSGVLDRRAGRAWRAAGDRRDRGSAA